MPSYGALRELEMRQDIAVACAEHDATLISEVYEAAAKQSLGTAIAFLCGHLQYVMTYFHQVRSRMDPASKVHLVQEWTVENYNDAGKRFVHESSSLLIASKYADPQLAHAASTKLDNVVISWWEHALAANMANPDMVQAALTTRMDTHEVSETPSSIISKAVQEMHLSATQQQIIASAYAKYRNTLPSKETRQEILQQLEEASFSDASQQSDGRPSYTEVLGQLDDCLKNSQQACMAMTTVSTPSAEQNLMEHIAAFVRKEKQLDSDASGLLQLCAIFARAQRVNAGCF
jgi:hypothetical protein